MISSHPLILLSHSRGIYIGPGMNLSPHKNTVATIAIALEAPFSLKFYKNGNESIQYMALIPPNTQHHLKPQGKMMFVYLDALSDDYASINKADLDRTNALNTDIDLQVLLKPNTKSTPEQQLHSLWQLLGIPQKRGNEARITSAVRAIDHRPQDFNAVEQAAKLTGLSPSRFQHLFRDAVGMPFRRYRLWRRMAVVAQTLATGDTLTNAALNAGFASSAHLSSTFRDMFGIRPSDLIAAKTRFQVSP